MLTTLTLPTIIAQFYVAHCLSYAKEGLLLHSRSRTSTVGLVLTLLHEVLIFLLLGGWDRPYNHKPDSQVNYKQQI